VDLDAVGGVEVVDDDGGGGEGVVKGRGAVGIGLAGGGVGDVVVDLQGAAARGLEDADGGQGVGAGGDLIAGVADQGAAERLGGAVVPQRQAGDRAEAGDLIAVVVENVGGGAGFD